MLQERSVTSEETRHDLPANEAAEETSELNTSVPASIVDEPTSQDMFVYYMMHDDGLDSLMHDSL